MPSRIDVELTSARPDGTWTWRAAGAREPRGVVEASVLPSGSKVGDVLKVEATIALDGIEIHSVVPAKGARKQPERIEVIGGREFEAVTTSLVSRRGRDADDRRGDRKDRGKRGERSDRGPRDRDRPGGERPGGERSGDRRGPATERGPRARPDGEGAARRPPRERRDRPSFAPVPELPQRPKPKRLKPGRAHRQALVNALPDEQKPIAEQLLRGGLPGLRQALADQNAGLRAEGKPEIKTAGIESLAQDLLPGIRVAEWLDRADAAVAVLDELDLRDLRSVVTAGADSSVARDDTTRERSAELRAALDRRQNEEHEHWLEDITAALDVGRVVRALRLSSRPPKAGVPFPAELSARLVEAATAALTPDAASDRWAAVIESLAFSPVHALVVPAAPPQQVSDELKAMVKGVASAVPEIAKLLGIDVPPPGSRSPRPPRLPRRPTKAKAKPTSSPGPSAPKPGSTRPPKPPREARPAAGPADTSAAPTDEQARSEAPPTEPALEPVSTEAGSPPEPQPEPQAAPAATDTAADAPTEAGSSPEPLAEPQAAPAATNAADDPTELAPSELAPSEAAASGSEPAELVPSTAPELPPEPVPAADEARPASADAAPEPQPEPAAHGAATEPAPAASEPAGEHTADQAPAAPDPPAEPAPSSSSASPAPEPSPGES